MRFLFPQNLDRGGEGGGEKRKDRKQIKCFFCLLFFLNLIVAPTSLSLVPFLSQNNFSISATCLPPPLTSIFPSDFYESSLVFYVSLLLFSNNAWVPAIFGYAPLTLQGGRKTVISTMSVLKVAYTLFVCQQIMVLDRNGI